MPVAAVFTEVRGLDVAAEIAAIHFSDFAFPADHAALQFGCHGFAEFVQQHESALVGDVQIAREGQRRLALDLIAEDRDGCEIAAQGQLVAGEQCTGRNREVLAASPATEPGRAFEAAAIVGINAAAMWTDRLAVRIGPTDTAERRFRPVRPSL